MNVFNNYRELYFNDHLMGMIDNEISILLLQVNFAILFNLLKRFCRFLNNKVAFFDIEFSDYKRNQFIVSSTTCGSFPRKIFKMFSHNFTLFLVCSAFYFRGADYFFSVYRASIKWSGFFHFLKSFLSNGFTFVLLLVFEEY